MTERTFSDPELIICAAVQMPDGYVIRGHRHDGALQTALGMPRYGQAKVEQSDQGFVTSRNRFVSREEAHRIHKGSEGMLFSEDLY